MVQDPPSHVLRVPSSPNGPQTPLPGWRLPPSPRCCQPPSHSMEDPLSVSQVIDSARKPSTNALYAYKWAALMAYTVQWDLPTSPTTLPVLLEFLLSLIHRGLSISIRQVCVAAIMAFQPQDSAAASLFRHPHLKTFFKGLMNIRRVTRLIPAQCSLTLVLQRLMRHPFEPLATVPLYKLSLKTAFLVAITSARRSLELAALRSCHTFPLISTDRPPKFFSNTIYRPRAFPTCTGCSSSPSLLPVSDFHSPHY
ncbi:hypothetical protein JRQ81_001990 [Phrynocephalus forsythii]|uniref:Uncharacterized protein n=1 Tax=Phrynocephalus forsythii TaxID=171643 RepID=A0A9Q0XH35_9SAUR|nr:hypothetical protein JRQ81_001990 [Phrynocephalus forsythii]